MIPDSSNATISNDVATGRKMNGREGLIAPSRSSPRLLPVRGGETASIALRHPSARVPSLPLLVMK